MMKRIFSLLIALCLIVGLLPAVAIPHAHAEETEVQHAMLRVMGYTDLHASTDGKSTYLKNADVECTGSKTVTADDGSTSTESYTFAGTKWAYAGNYTATEPEEWNVKFEYPAGGVPTLTLKGAILDWYDEENDVYSTHVGSAYHAAITGKTNEDYYGGTNQVLDLNVVIAEDSYIATAGSVVASSNLYGNVTVTSVGDAKLTARSTNGIRANSDLILNANIDVQTVLTKTAYETATVTNKGTTSGTINIPAVYSAAGDVIINGGDITIDATSGAIIHSYAGNVVINGGNMTLNGRWIYKGSYLSYSNGAIKAATSITVNGGAINAQIGYDLFTCTGTADEPKILITGGSVAANRHETLKANYQIPKGSYVKMTGGSLKLYNGGGNTVYNAEHLNVSEHPCCVIMTGSDEASATVKTAVAKAAYVSVTAHDLTEVGAVTPDCVNDGNIAHWHCAQCEKNFADAEAKTELESIVDPATGVHTAGEIVKENEVAAGCNEGGTYEAVEYCTGCGVEMSRTTVAVDPLGHTEVEVAEKAPTVDAVGTTAGTKCSVCGAILSGCEEIPKLRTEMIRVDGYDDIKASEDGRSSYLVNEEVECTYTITNEDGETETVTFTGYTWKIVGSWTSTEPEEWNVKYSFPAGGVPTLTLKGAIMDLYDETTGNYATNYAAAYHNAILGKTFENDDVYDLHIIIEEDSTITTNGTLLGDGGGEYFHNVTVESVGDAKLTARTSKGIAAKYGSLTLNANLEIEVPKYNGSDSYPLYTTGDVTVNGGNYKLSSSATGTTLWAGPTGSLIRAGGNITINDGSFDLDSSYYSTTGGLGVIHANGGDITINAGSVDIQHGVITAFYATASGTVVVNGGSVITEGSYYAMGGSSGILKVNGGTVEMYRPGGSAYHTDYPIDMSGNPNWMAYAGTSAEDAKEVEEIPNTSKYIKIVSLEGEAPSCEHTNTTTNDEIVADETCTDTGSKKITVTCDDCGEIISETTEELAALGHTEEIIPGKAATCTETGLTEGKKCSVCGEILVAQEEIAALGHTEVTSVEEQAATCTAAGSKKTTVSCSVCGETVSETTEELAALGHTEEAIAGKDATCAETGLTAGVKCSVCGEILTAQEEIPATGEHTFDDDNDTTCNNCDYIRNVEITLTVNENNKLVFVDPNAENIYHRVTVYYLGDETVEDITLTNPLKAIDPTAKTYWGATAINTVVLQKTGKYVVHLDYNTSGSPRIRVAKEFTVTSEIAAVPTIEVENGKLIATDENANNLYHRATVYYLGAETVSNIYDVEALKAIDPDAKTYWTLDEINKVLLTKTGDYVVHLDYNTAGSNKLTVAEQFAVVASRPTISRDGYKLIVTDSDETHKNHRATVYFIGSETVDIYDEAALKAIDTDAKTYWGLTAINKAQMATPGSYVIYLSYNLENGLKQTMVVKTTTSMPVPSVWLEESGQIGTIVPDEVAHRNYEIYYLGDQTVEDIYDIEALKAIDPDPICFDNQKQIAERGVLTEKGNYVLVMYYNYVGSARQVIAEFATLA